MFPLYHRGELRRSKTTVTKIGEFERVFMLNASNELKKVKARNVEIQGNRISFGGGMFRFTSNWNILTQIDYGYLEIKEAQDEFIISYFISFKELLILASALIILMGGILFFQNAELSLVGKLVILAFGWGWLFGMNWLIAMVRFPAFVERIVLETRI